jgi:hypothetical protein
MTRLLDEGLAAGAHPSTFDRDLQSLIHQPGFEHVRGLMIGRFQKASGMTTDLLRTIIETKLELRPLPVIASVDFGHTDPKITLPIGGIGRLIAGMTARSITCAKYIDNATQPGVAVIVIAQPPLGCKRRQYSGPPGRVRSRIGHPANPARVAGTTAGLAGARP